VTAGVVEATAAPGGVVGLWTGFGDAAFETPATVPTTPVMAMTPTAMRRRMVFRCRSLLIGRDMGAPGMRLLMR
jgi:hypothetical protein